jgi:hypothetical protein
VAYFKALSHHFPHRVEGIQAKTQKIRSEFWLIKGSPEYEAGVLSAAL